MIENAEDVMGEISDLINKDQKLEFLDSEDKDFHGFKPKIPSENELNSARKEILQNLSHSPIAFEDLLSLSQIPTNIANIILIQLELADIIENNHDMINLKQK